MKSFSESAIAVHKAADDVPSILAISDLLAKYMRALDCCREQRNAYFSIASTITGDKDNKDDDEVIKKILKGEL